MPSNNSILNVGGTEDEQTQICYAMTWDIEVLARNIHSLKGFTQNHFPDLIFLSEPTIFQHDLDLVMSHLCGE